MREGTKPRPAKAPNFIIKRPRLTKLLDDSGARLILLVAPAGYGKTTLAREWTSAFRRPLAWYQASTASSDVAALATGLAVELDQAVGDGATTAYDRMAAMTPYQQQPDVLARALARCVEWPRDLIVVVDDYHHLSASAGEAFVERLASEMSGTFLVTSRTRPRWLTPRRALYGEATVVGAETMAMTEDEAGKVLETSRDDVLPSIVASAQGWPVILGLAARTGPAELPADVLPRRLYEYLADELIQTTTAATQRALTLLAVTGTRDAGLARELIGTDVTRALTEAELRGLLTVDASNELHLHPLLREYLITRLREKPDRLEIGPLIANLKRRRLWDECLHVVEALPEAAAFAGAVLVDSLQDLLRGGRATTVRRLVAVAQRLELDDPILELAEAELAFRDGSHARALTLGSRAAGRLTSPDLKSRAQLVAARAAQLGDQPEAAMCLFQGAVASAADRSVRARALWGHFLASGDLEGDDLLNLLNRFAAADDGSVEHAIQIGNGRSLLKLLTCELDEAITAVKEVQPLGPRCKDPMITLSCINQLAWSETYAARYEDALATATEVIAQAELAALGFVLDHGLLAKARALVGLRRFAEAKVILGRVGQSVRVNRDEWTSVEHAINTVRFHLSLGNIDAARDAAMIEPSEQLNRCIRSELYSYRALIELAMNRPKKASAWTQRSETSRRVEARALAAVVEAALARRGDVSQVAALDFVLNSGCHDAIVMGCRATPTLGVAMAGNSRHRDRLESILTRSRDEALARSLGLHVPRTTRRTETLSPRELEVFELLAQGRTNHQIAQSLFITESTTKIHVRHIFEKLGVRTRVEAAQAWPGPQSD